MITNSNIRRACFSVLCLIIMTSSFTSMKSSVAAMVSLNAVNSNSQVYSNQTNSRNIRWTVNNNLPLVPTPPLGALLPTPTVVHSVQGQFLAPDNSFLGSVNKTLSHSQPSSGPTIFQINENLIIPLSIIKKVKQSGYKSFKYLRTFTDNVDASSLTAITQFSLVSVRTGIDGVSSSTGEVAIHSITLRFDDRRRSAIVGQNDKLRAVAQLKYNGTGMIEYRWEQASPPSTRGQTIYIPIKTGRIFMSAKGQNVLTSPVLTTNKTGEYHVRIVIKRPEPEFISDSLRYGVNNANKVESDKMIKTIRLLYPEDVSSLHKETIFKWKSIPEANAYQLELHDKPLKNDNHPGVNNTPLVSGVLVSSSTPYTDLKDVSRAHLRPGVHYYWRVVGFDHSGNIIARSQFREIKIP